MLRSLLGSSLNKHVSLLLAHQPSEFYDLKEYNMPASPSVESNSPLILVLTTFFMQGNHTAPYTRQIHKQNSRISLNSNSQTNAPSKLKQKLSSLPPPNAQHLMFASALGSVQLPTGVTASMGTIPALPVGDLLEHFGRHTSSNARPLRSRRPEDSSDAS